MRRAFLLLLVAILAAGCWDRAEINDVAFVAATAVDKEDDQYRVSLQIPIPARLGQGGGQQGGAPTGGGGAAGGKAWYVDSALGPTLRSANEQQQKSISRQLFFGHRRVMIFSEEVAREGLAPHLDVLVRVPQNRLAAYLTVSRGPARDILTVDSPGEPLPAEMAREMSQAPFKTPPTLLRFLQTLLDKGIDPILPAVERRMTEPGAEGNPQSVVRLTGLAVFRSDKLVGFLTGNEASGVLWAMGEIRNPTEQFRPTAKGGAVSVQFQELRTRLVPVLQGERLTMRIRIQAKGTIVENSTHYLATPDESMRDLAEAIEQQLADRITRAVRKLQTEFGADPIGFGEAVRHRYPAYWHRIAPAWERRYPNVVVSVEPAVIVEHAGTALRPFTNLRGEIRQ